eukprot:635827-Prorocentrum_lima.AAC.1
MPLPTLSGRERVASQSTAKEPALSNDWYTISSSPKLMMDTSSTMHVTLSLIHISEPTRLDVI